MKYPYCPKCLHFQLKHADPFPYQCTLWEIKSVSQHPTYSVYRATGQHCNYFKAKNVSKKNKNKKSDKESDFDVKV